MKRKRTTANLPTPSPLPFHQLRSIVFSLQMNRCRVGMETGQSLPVRSLCLLFPQEPKPSGGGETPMNILNRSGWHPQGIPGNIQSKHTCTGWSPPDNIPSMMSAIPTGSPRLDTFRQTDILKKQLERKQFGTNPDMDTTGRTRLSQGDKQLLTFLTLPGEKRTFVRDKCNLHVLLRSPAKHDQHICNEPT